MRKLVLFLPLLFVIIASIYLYFGPTPLTDPQPSSSPSSTTTATPTINPTNSTTGPVNSYTITIPPGFIINSEGEFSRTIAKDVAVEGQGNPSFIYISIIPKGQEQAEGTIYNYNQADFTKLVRSQPGTTVVLGELKDQNLNSFFTYNHTEGRMLGGYGAKAFTNTKPWEFPAGTTEYRYIIEMANVQYLIGAYLNTESTSPRYISSAEFDQILSTLKLTPDKIVLTNLPPVTKGQTKTYNSSQHKLTFAYPADWTPRETLEQNQIFAIYKIGQTQRTQTEMYDGGAFAVYAPQPAPSNLQAWIKAQYQETENSSRPPEFSQYSANNITYQVVRECGLGCFDYYHTIQNGKLYRFMLTSVGPQEKQYTDVLHKIINTVTYL